MAFFAWDDGKWDGAEWGQPPQGEAGWGKDWVWWWQRGDSVAIFTDLTKMVVEARWTTDSHTLGDGTFRGDLQPGQITLRLWDPHRTIETLDHTGSIWAQYVPTGATWHWIYESLARGLYAPGDPAAADCVFTGSAWPSRLTTLTAAANFPAQSVNARLTALAANLNANLQLHLPPVAANIAGQTQVAAATAADSTTGLYPSYLQQIRDAASPGVAWLSDTRRGDGLGVLTLNYARWETNVQRALDRSQIVAGPPTLAGIDQWVITNVAWAGVNGSTGAQTAWVYTSPNAQNFGYLGPSAMRMWGDVHNAGTGGWGPEFPAIQTTSNTLVNDHTSVSEQNLSTVSLQSGPRWTPDGKPSAAGWDPYGHVFGPTDVAVITDDAGHPRYYRVTHSEHRLTASVWQTIHTLEKYTAPAALP